MPNVVLYEKISYYLRSIKGLLHVHVCIMFLLTWAESSSELFLFLVVRRPSICLSVPLFLNVLHFNFQEPLAQCILVGWEFTSIQTFSRGDNCKIEKYTDKIKKIFFSRTTGPTSIKTWQKHLWVKGIRLVQMKDHALFQMKRVTKKLKYTDEILKKTLGQYQPNLAQSVLD